MQIDIPFDGGTLVALVGFVGAVIFQSAMLKRNVEIITQRMTKIEDNMSKITELLISNEGLSQRVTALSERLRHTEDVATTMHVSQMAALAPKSRARKPPG